MKEMNQSVLCRIPNPYKMDVGEQEEGGEEED